MNIEITDNSGLVKEEMQAAVLRALTKCGLAAEGYAKKLCPVDTGNLRNSITYAVDQGGDVVYIGTNSEYGAYVIETRSLVLVSITPEAVKHRGRIRTAKDNGI